MPYTSALKMFPAAREDGVAARPNRPTVAGRAQSPTCPRRHHLPLANRMISVSLRKMKSCMPSRIWASSRRPFWPAYRHLTLVGNRDHNDARKDQTHRD